MDTASLKAQAAQAALSELPQAGIVGLGSGSTAALFIDGVGALVAQGRSLQGVATSEASRIQAERLGIPLLPDPGPWPIDVCVDGADEVSAELDLIKGGGGCHAREKIVNAAAKLNIIVVDDSKLSKRLGERWAVPVEVMAFGHRQTAAHLAALGEVTMRMREGQPWCTDGGNFIYDVRVGPIDEPLALDRALLEIPGVAETGLFLGRANKVIVAAPGGIQVLSRPAQG